MSILKDLFSLAKTKNEIRQQVASNHIAITYADAQIRHQIALQQMAMQQQQHQAQMNQYGGAGKSGGMGTSSATWSTAVGQQSWVTSSSASGIPFVRDFRMVQQKSDLDHAVFKTPVEDLVNIWIARYGTDWVNKQEVLNDEFFEWAAMRLRSLGRLEEHTIWHQEPIALHSSQKTVLRIVDKT